MSFAAGDVDGKQGTVVGFENVERRAGPRVDFNEPGGIGRNDEIRAVEADEAECGGDPGDGAGDFFGWDSADLDRTGGAAISKRRRRSRRGPLQTQTDDFGPCPIRGEQRGDGPAGDAALEITIIRSDVCGRRRGDVRAPGAASPLHQPAFRFVRRRKEDRRMRYPVRLAKSASPCGSFARSDCFGFDCRICAGCGQCQRSFPADARSPSHRRAQSDYRRQRASRRALTTLSGVSPSDSPPSSFTAAS